MVEEVRCDICKKKIKSLAKGILKYNLDSMSIQVHQPKTKEFKTLMCYDYCFKCSKVILDFIEAHKTTKEGKRK